MTNDWGSKEQSNLVNLFQCKRTFLDESTAFDDRQDYGYKPYYVLSCYPVRSFVGSGLSGLGVCHNIIYEKIMTKKTSVSENQRHKKKIAMIVYNSVSHDARVLKEAESLVNAGYKVCIFGLQDNYNVTAHEVLQNGVEIIRVDWKSRLIMRRAMHRAYFMLFRYVLAGLLVFPLALSLYSASPALFWASLASISVIFIGMLKFFKAMKTQIRLKNVEANVISSVSSKSFTITRFVNDISAEMSYLLKRYLISKEMRRAVLIKIKEYNPHVIHCHDLITLPAGSDYKRNNKCFLVYDSHEIYEEQGSFSHLRKIPFFILQKYYSRSVDGLITINESIAKFLCGRYPRFPNAVILRNATRKLDHAVEYDGRLHNAAGLPEETKILLYQGGFAAKRGLDILLSSAPALPDSWCIVMMGWGNIEEELKRIATEVDPNSEKIRFIPGVPQNELTLWTAGGTIGIIPYENVNLNHWYCTPNKLWEYPNAGVPLLVSPFPEMKKIVDTHKIGWLLDDPVTPECIGEILANIGDDEIIEKKKACEAFIEKDNWTVYEKRLVEMYNGIQC